VVAFNDNCVLQRLEINKKHRILEKQQLRGREGGQAVRRCNYHGSGEDNMEEGQNFYLHTVSQLSGCTEQ
jgi:hypothetical protein